MRKFIPKVRVLRFERDRETGYWFLRLDWMWPWLYKILEPMMVMVYGADKFLDIQLEEKIKKEYTSYQIDYYNGRNVFNSDALTNSKPQSYDKFRETFLSCITASLWFDVSEEVINGYTDKLFLSAHNEKIGLMKVKHGRLYTCTLTEFDAEFIVKTKEFDNVLWLCNVTWWLFMFRFPETLFVKVHDKSPYN